MRTFFLAKISDFKNVDCDISYLRRLGNNYLLIRFAVKILVWFIQPKLLLLKKKSSKEFTGTNVYAIIAVSKLSGSSWKSINSVQTHLKYANLLCSC